MITSLLASVEAPAAGAPLVQIAIATVFAVGSTLALLWLIQGHRTGRSALLGRAGKRSARLLGMQPWAALPTLVASIGLAAGALGVFWDISLHIEKGRDVGPLANPSHYPILFALYSIFAAGMLSIALHERAAQPSKRALRLPVVGMDAPVGGALLLGAGVFALTGFPLDDLWHRMFGQDVTLWGPTHLIMINGAILTVPILIVLTLEAKRAAGHDMAAPPTSVAERVARLFLPGAFLFAIAFWATEFDWGVQQYRMVWHPLLLAVAGGLALVVGRLWLGRGGALQVAAMYIALRVGMNLFVMGMGQTAPVLPLFLVEALLIELLWLRGRPEDHPLRFGALAGLVCGTAGFAAHYAWTQVASPAPWTVSMLPEAIPTAILAGVAGGVLGGLMGAGLRGDLPTRSVRRPLALAATGVLVVLGANALVVQNPSDLRADVTLTPVASDDGREAILTARISDPEFVRDASMRYVLAWQEGLRTIDIEEVAPGVWRSAEPVPLHGEWKTMLRLANGYSMVSIPLHRPADPEVPAPGITRPEAFSASFLPDTEVIQSERKDYVPGWLWAPSALIMLLLCGLFVTGIAAGIARVTDPEEPRDGERSSGRGRRLLAGRFPTTASPAR